MSVKAESSVTINRPPQAVFAALTDVAHHADWAKGVAKVGNLSHNPVVLGSSWTQVSRVMGREVESHGKVVRYEANRVFTTEVDKPFPGQMTWTVEPDGQGTKVNLSVDIQPGGFFSVAAPLLSGSIRNAFKRDLNMLKARLEAAA